jgi:L-aminopeptidase/D-esterase-like protein
MVGRATEPLNVGGVRVGHATDPTGMTGVTVALFESATPVVVDVRGGASATYDLASLTLEATFGRRWAVFFSGGSLFGLDAATGIRERILETGGGQSVFRNPRRVAPISGAALFDLPGRDGSIPDYRPLGYTAAASSSTRPIPSGRIGAGAGALVGKYRGRAAAMRGGLGWAAESLAHRGHLGALVVINAVGAVRDPANGRWVAGARGPRGRIFAPGPGRGALRPSLGTTLSLILTDYSLDRPVMQRIAHIAHAGLGSAILPFHSATDGDVMFVAATGTAGLPPREERPGAIADELGLLAAGCAVRAALRAVRASNARR